MGLHVIFEVLQSSVTIRTFASFSNICSPQPIAAGSKNSAERIAICEFAPPYLVIKPAIFFEKIQSNPGSAFSIRTILLAIFVSILRASSWTISARMTCWL